MESIVDNSDRLHFFEHVEVDLLQQYLRNGIHYFVNAMLNGYPSLVGLRYFSLQISTMIDFAKDFYYLMKYKATYAEEFFNLQRKLQSNSKMKALQGAIIFTIIPYVCTKVDNFYNQIIADDLDGKNINTLKKVVKIIYPYLYALVGVIQVIYKFKYLFIQGQTQNFYSIFYQINRINLAHKKQEGGESKYPVMDLIKKPGLLIVLMAHKIINWYFSQKNKRASAKSNQINEGQMVKAPLNQKDLRAQGICPLCTKEIINATMVRTSGYVYCFTCISEYAKKMKICPMSQLPISQNTLQIIYT